jgi:hypothetical protein
MAPNPEKSAGAIASKDKAAEKVSLMFVDPRLVLSTKALERAKDRMIIDSVFKVLLDLLDPVTPTLPHVLVKSHIKPPRFHLDPMIYPVCKSESLRIYATLAPRSWF